MKKKMNRFWYLLDYQDLISEKEKIELRNLYDELYEEFTEEQLQYIDYVW